MLCHSKFYIVCLLAPGFYLKAGAQVFTSDTAFVQLAVQHATAIHHRELGEQLRLYNGLEYHRPITGAKGHPYFLSDSMQPSSLLYDDAGYANVPLLYDLQKDQVITTSFDKLHDIQLVTSKVDNFNIGGHQFARLTTDSAKGITLPTGFYEVLYHNKTIAIARREKKLKEVAKVERLESSYQEFVYYYIINKSALRRINSSADLLNIAGDKKNELKTYLRKKGLKFKKQREETIKYAAAWIDQTT